MMRRATALLSFAALASVIVACSRRDPLIQPRPAHVAATAPDSFLVQFETTRGPFMVMAHRTWSPAGVDRFHYLVSNGFYDGARFFRAIRNFVVQFGIPADPAVAAIWENRSIPDDRVNTTNARGTISFARGGRETRSTQLFVNLRANGRLDTLSGFGFPPIGVVTSGMAVVDSLYNGYGEGPPRGQGPSQDSLRLQGNAYLDRSFPLLDAIASARVMEAWPRQP